MRLSSPCSESTKDSVDDDYPRVEATAGKDIEHPPADQGRPEAGCTAGGFTLKTYRSPPIFLYTATKSRPVN
jgi:hypothetical protein